MTDKKTLARGGVLAAMLLLWANSSFVYSLQQFDVCQIFGAVYLEKDPRKADYKVFVENSETSSDLVVFKEDSRLFADKAGLWCFTDKPAFADFSVAYVDKKGQADFSVFFTDREFFAGCNK